MRSTWTRTPSCGKCQRDTVARDSCECVQRLTESQAVKFDAGAQPPPAAVTRGGARRQSDAPNLMLRARSGRPGPAKASPRRVTGMAVVVSATAFVRNNPPMGCARLVERGMPRWLRSSGSHRPRKRSPAEAAGRTRAGRCVPRRPGAPGRPRRYPPASAPPCLFLPHPLPRRPTNAALSRPALRKMQRASRSVGRRRRGASTGCGAGVAHVRRSCGHSVPPGAMRRRWTPLNCSRTAITRAAAHAPGVRSFHAAADVGAAGPDR
jgi:hypothetical protein